MGICYEDKVPIGYKLVNGKLEVDELRAEIVKWTYGAYLDYTENPPRFLIDEAIAAYRDCYHKELTYEEAKEHVSHQQILDYMTTELNQKIRLYNVGDEKTPESLKKLLDLSVEEVKEFYDKLPAEKQIAAAEVKVVEHSPIISREDFEAVQKRITQNQVQSF